MACKRDMRRDVWQWLYCDCGAVTWRSIYLTLLTVVSNSDSDSDSDTSCDSCLNQLICLPVEVNIAAPDISYLGLFTHLVGIMYPYKRRVGKA